MNVCVAAIQQNRVQAAFAFFTIIGRPVFRVKSFV